MDNSGDRNGHMISFGKQAAIILLQKAREEIASGKRDPLSPDQRRNLEQIAEAA